MRILIADDSKIVRRCIAELLSTDGTHELCGEAADSKETLEKTNELRPDLVLLDVSMPGVSGLETARLLRQQAPDVKILIMSQNDASQLLPQSKKAGADGCLDKAEIATQLLPMIQSALQA
ncbi:MAG TPA: response regulator transcription factor [Terriglobales bacterium]|nr:response regulator transcription factor [Terriglobales bacterium]